MIERLVARLVAEPKLRKALVFKGGFVGLRVYENDRYTIDFDALLLKANLAQTLELTKLAASQKNKKPVIVLIIGEKHFAQVPQSAVFKYLK